MKRNRKWLFLAALFVLALPLMLASTASAYNTHVDGATINSSGGWDLPSDYFLDCPNAVSLGDTSQQTRKSCLNFIFPNYTDSTSCSTAPNGVWNSSSSRRPCYIPFTNAIDCAANGGTYHDTSSLDGAGGGATCTYDFPGQSAQNTDACTDLGGTMAPGAVCGSNFTHATPPEITDGGNDWCLRCHNTIDQYNSNPNRWKDKYLWTGHRNMSRLTSDYPLGGAVYTAENSPSHDNYGGVSGSPYATTHTLADNVLLVYGGWYRNRVTARINGDSPAADNPSKITTSSSSYCGAYCHTTGPNAWDASSQLGGIAGDVFKAAGVQCTRCHDHSADGIESDTDYFATGVPGPSRHEDQVPEGPVATALCYECHEQSVEPYEVATNSSQGTFLGHYRTNQFLTSPHARFSGSEHHHVAEEAYYDSHFDGGCVGCHDVHIGAADPANSGDDHINNRCGIECHNPQSPYSHGGYSGFHDFFVGFSPDTRSTEANCSVHNAAWKNGYDKFSYDNQTDCENAGGYWNEAGTPGNNPEACVLCHMQAGTNHLWRINTDPAYSPFGGTKAATEPDEDGYVHAVWNSLEMVCGQCHMPGGANLGKTGRELDLLTLAEFAEDYHSHAAAEGGECQIGGVPCFDDADCIADVCSRTASIECVTDADCPVNETCVAGGEICQYFRAPGEATSAYARFNWYYGQGNDCYEVYVDGTDNGMSCSWTTDDGGATFDPSASACVTKITFTTGGTHTVTLNTGSGTRTMIVEARGKMHAAAGWTLAPVSLDGMQWQVTDGSSAATCANPGGEQPVMHVLWGDGTTSVVQKSTGTTVDTHTYDTPGIYTVGYCIKTTEDVQDCVTPVTINVPADTETCDVTGNIAGVVINYGTEITLWEDPDNDINTPNSIIKRAYTDTNGDFVIPNVQGGRSYRVVPSRNGYSFAEAVTNNHTYAIMLDCSLGSADGGPNNHDFDATATW